MNETKKKMKLETAPYKGNITFKSAIIFCCVYEYLCYNEVLTHMLLLWAVAGDTYYFVIHKHCR